jgi:hypothetical protein
MLVVGYTAYKRSVSTLDRKLNPAEPRMEPVVHAARAGDNPGRAAVLQCRGYQVRRLGSRSGASRGVRARAAARAEHRRGAAARKPHQIGIWEGNHGEGQVELCSSMRRSCARAGLMCAGRGRVGR